MTNNPKLQDRAIQCYNRVEKKIEFLFEGFINLIKLCSNNVINWFKSNSKLLFLWFILIIAGLIFQDKITNLIFKYSFLGEKEVGNIWFNPIFYILTIFIILRFFWLIIINYRLSKYFYFWVLGIAVVYFIAFRNDFLLINYNESIFYVDIILLTFFLTFLLFIRNFFGDFQFYYRIKNKINQWLNVTKIISDNIFLEDTPKDGKENNELDSVANELISTIKDFKPNQAFIIAINAKWGYGKTSFLKRLEYKLGYENKQIIPPIIFWFNTWQHQDEKTIINNFFGQLKKELSAFDGNAELVINKYVGKLFTILYQKQVRLLKAFTDDLIGDNTSIEDYYYKIENILSKLNRQIVVFVDDLDRLNKSEILETIRILRNVANFKNIIFICGVDKQYIIQKGELESNYLDKIFNVEISLPKINETGLFIYFKELIRNTDLVKVNTSPQLPQNISINESVIEALETILYSDDGNILNISEFWFQNEINLTDKATEDSLPLQIPLLPSIFFNSRRDVKRFFNYLVANLRILRDVENIELYDYILFHLLLFKYDWMRINFEDRNINYWLDGNVVLKFKEKSLEKLNKLNNTTDKIDENTIYTILLKLFPDSKDNYLVSGKGIRQKRYFPIYINNNIFNDSFSYSDLLKAHKDNKLKNLIEEKIKNTPEETYLLNDVKAFILKEENLQSEQEYIQAIRLINTDYFQDISEMEMLAFVNYGEDKFKDKFEEIANKEIFIDIKNTFGELLLKLNFHYSTEPKEYHIAHLGGIDNFNEFFRNRIKENKDNNTKKANELKFIDHNYTKDKLIELIDEYLKGKVSLTDVNGKIVWCVEKYFTYFHFRYYYKGITGKLINYLKINFKTVFLTGEPQYLVSIIDLRYFASIFVDDSDEEKRKVDNQVEEIMKKGSFSADDLKINDFIKVGLNNFLKFFESIDNIDSESNFSEDELRKYIEFTDLLRKRIKPFI